MGPLGPQERFDRVRLIRSPHVGPVSHAMLLRRFGSAGAALAALPDLARRGGGRGAVASAERIEREHEAVARAGARYLFRGEPGYPALLAELEDAPPVLTVRGDLAVAARPMLAMVGARNASAAACRLAREWAAELAGAGLAVVSGLARGIDTAAHLGAMAASGAPAATVACIASGIDIAYPPENRDLQARIADEALLLAEQPPGTEPLARHFPYRNRIIAGLSLGTLVVEAAPRSGSLITARLAGEAGREVMAVPGSPLDPRARGCNGLIREGATLVQSPAEVLEALGGIGDARLHRDAPIRLADPGDPAMAEPEEAARSRLVSLLGPVRTGVNELARQAGMATAEVQAILLELELAGRLDRHAGGEVSLR